MGEPPKWKGTPELGVQLRAALLANCMHRADLDRDGKRDSFCWGCPSCLLLMSQRDLDGLLWAKETKAARIEQEWDESAAPTEPPAAAPIRTLPWQDGETT